LLLRLLERLRWQRPDFFHRPLERLRWQRHRGRKLRLPLEPCCFEMRAELFERVRRLVLRMRVAA
jgi:hypothetical protein